LKFGYLLVRLIDAVASSVLFPTAAADCTAATQSVRKRSAS